MKHFLVFIISISHFVLAFAQQQKDTTDLKVGLVLSGGGAKGLAHIGVLKVIDESGIRLDYISGSSIGAIVGGLYASGYSAKQLDSLFRAVDFSALIQDKLPRRSKTFYEKEDAEKYALSLPISKGKIVLPKGISNGQNFYNFYSKLTTHVRHITDFKNLPIPFFCTGTDIETGEALIFDSGYLPDVVAASSALPTVYSPVRFRGRLITDGGVTDNYPIEEIKRRGAELVIGVDVQDSLMNRNQLESVSDIMLQISNFRTIKDMKRKAPLTDVYIRPNIRAYSLLSFQDGEAIISLGKKEAETKLEILKAIANQQKTKVTNKFKPIEKIRIAGLIIKNNSRFTRSYIKGKLRVKTPSVQSLDNLNKGLDNLYSTGNFERIRYKIIKDNYMNENLLSVDVIESKYKSAFRLGLHYDNLYKSAAIVNYTKKNLLYKNDVLSLDAILGDMSRYNIDYYIDKGYYWSFGLSHRLYYLQDLDLDFIRKDRNLSSVDTRDINYLDITTQLYLETVLGQKFAFRIGLEHKFIEAKNDEVGIGENRIKGTVFDRNNYYSIFTSVKFDSFDDKYFPSKGAFFGAKFSGYPISSESAQDFKEFAIAKTQLKYALPLVKNLSLQLGIEGGFRIGNQSDINALDFFLGGFGSKLINNQVSFYGYDFFRLSGDSFAKADMQLDYNFFEKHHFNLAANYANVGKGIFDLKNWFKKLEFSGYAVGYGYNSIIGPIQVKYAFSPDDLSKKSQLFFSVGYWF